MLKWFSAQLWIRKTSGAFSRTQSEATNSAILLLAYKASSTRELALSLASSLTALSHHDQHKHPGGVPWIHLVILYLDAAVQPSISVGPNNSKCGPWASSIDLTRALGTTESEAVS